MIIIYELSSGNILAFRSVLEGKRQFLQQRYIPKHYSDLGVTKTPVPDEEIDQHDIHLIVPYSWEFADAFVSVVEVRNLPVARIIVADPIPVLNINPVGLVLGLTLSAGTYYSRGQLKRVDDSGG